MIPERFYEWEMKITFMIYEKGKGLRDQRNYISPN